ncbi:MAG: hypothetical protein D6806_01980, partial [Deltaproteobacteria bacterium]
MDDVFDTIVVGASAAGLRCACRLKRLKPRWRVGVVEASDFFSYAACGLPYFLSGDIQHMDALRSTAWGSVRDSTFFERTKDLEMIAPARAVSIDAVGRRLEIERAGDRKWLRWKRLVIATGARPIVPQGISTGGRTFCFHDSSDARVLHELLSKGKLGTVVVAGAGAIGCELAEAFTALWGAEVVLVEAREWPLSGMVDAEIGAIVAAELRRNDVKLLCRAPLGRVEERKDGVFVEAGTEKIDADALVLALGVRPNVDLARRAGIEIGPCGGIKVDESMAASRDGIYAVGDCVEVIDAVSGRAAYMPLGSLANRQGRCLANVVAGREDSFGPVCGAAVVKVFDLQVASAGLTLERARAAGIETEKVWVNTHDHAHYYPGHEDVFVQLSWSARDGRITGLQAVGNTAVALIDKAALLIRQHATIREGGRLIEHAYAPPYAQALDPLEVAVAVARNMEEDGLRGISPLEPLEGRRLLDVRSKGEAESGPLEGAEHVEFEAVRQAAASLDSDGEILVVCERGTRSAEAARILLASGRRAVYL